jgi:hypothetical protein
LRKRIKRKFFRKSQRQSIKEDWCFCLNEEELLAILCERRAKWLLFVIDVVIVPMVVHGVLKYNLTPTKIDLTASAFLPVEKDGSQWLVRKCMSALGTLKQRRKQSGSSNFSRVLTRAT